MVSIKDAAQSYVPASSLNIADLEEVSVEEDIVEKTYKEGEDDEYTNNVLVRDGKDYRVPDVVLKQLKVQVAAKPDMKTFKVNKEGSGINGTTYTVISLE